MLMTKLSRKLQRELTEEEQQSFKNKIKEIKAQGGTLDELIEVLKKGIDEKKALPFAIKNTKKIWKELEED